MTDKPEPERRRAVALSYEPGVDSAPRVVAQGQGELAERIIELARQHSIVIKENPALAQALVRLAPGQEIPPELYRVVAEIIAFVFRLKGGNPKEPTAPASPQSGH